MRSVGLLVLASLALACGPSPDAKLPSYPHSNGGETSAGSGGETGSGGSAVVGTGGRTVEGSGGAGTGGRVSGVGGARDGTGGRGSGTGGRGSGTGGRATGTGGREAGTGGEPGTGGRSVSGRGGGSGDDGGRGGGPAVGTGGRGSGTGGIVGGTGGTPGRDGAAGGDAMSGCMAQVVSNGYACGSAAPCSACKVNNVSKEAECQKGVDCLAAAGASCDGNCQLRCLNEAGDAQVGACIKALQTAACGGTGC